MLMLDPLETLLKLQEKFELAVMFEEEHAIPSRRLVHIALEKAEKKMKTQAKLYLIIKARISRTDWSAR